MVQLDLYCQLRIPFQTVNKVELSFVNAPFTRASENLSKARCSPENEQSEPLLKIIAFNANK